MRAAMVSGSETVVLLGGTRTDQHGQHKQSMRLKKGGCGYAVTALPV